MTNFVNNKLYEVQNTNTDQQPLVMSPFDSELTITNFAVKQLQIQDYYLLPRIVETHTIAPGAPGLISSSYWHRDTILQHWPQIFLNYSLVRFDLKFDVILTPSWNHTGLVSISYHPRLGAFKDLSETNDFVWYLPPNMRTFARLGKDTSMTITVPWMSAYGAYNYPESNSNPPSMIYVDPLSGSHQFHLKMNRMTTVGTVANAVQSVGVKIIATPINIQVGGYLGGNRLNAT